MDIVRYYSPEKNPRRATFPFQPLCDISAEEWGDLTESQQASVDASGFWRKAAPASKSEAKRLAYAPAAVPESEAVNG